MSERFPALDARAARRNFERNGLAAKIRLLQADALDVLADLARGEPFDIVFIDGSKERYREFMEQTVPLLAPRGILIVDDVFFHGDAINAAPTTEKGRGAKAALDLAAGMETWLRVVVPIANGILLMVRK